MSAAHDEHEDEHGSRQQKVALCAEDWHKEVKEGIVEGVINQVKRPDVQGRKSRHRFVTKQD